ncbi:unnamed protein product [Adineta steineri]|uniref:Uncharacterized protein n=1 Tax=Adineta steineri TaxID=433720 RepID=A0A815QQA0_9BILA|nr:unnamed protein product [Adineta steineri]CAF1466578.1 unnamed protein product [Adineta steineri]CAF1634579.1 unnamed protein product [Adineta steineri]CAF1634604.1 unnamed protein product [Adineta steineri]
MVYIVNNYVLVFSEYADSFVRAYNEIQNRLNCCNTISLINETIDDWYFLDVIFRNLIQRCSTIRTTKIYSYPSLFHCLQSLKCISKHRLSDGSNDCYYGEDESFSACQLNDSKRFICPSESNKCLSIVTLENRKTDCLNGEDELTYDERNAFQGLIPFGFIYNGIYDFSSMKHIVIGGHVIIHMFDAIILGIVLMVMMNLIILEKTVHSMNTNVTMNI